MMYGMEFRVKLVASHRWSIQPAPNIVLPQELSHAEDHFSEFFTLRNPRRNEMDSFAWMRYYGKKSIQPHAKDGNSTSCANRSDMHPKSIQFQERDCK